MKPGHALGDDSEYEKASAFIAIWLLTIFTRTMAFHDGRGVGIVRSDIFNQNKEIINLISVSLI